MPECPECGSTDVTADGLKSADEMWMVCNEDNTRFIHNTETGENYLPDDGEESGEESGD